MAIIIDGIPIEMRGISSVSYLDLPELALKIGPGLDGRPRNDPPDIRGIVLHTTKGIPGGTDKRKQVIRPGFGPRVDAGERCARYWSGSAKQSGAHLVVDFDGQVACCADLLRTAAYHAGPVNELTIGIEIYQGSDAELYEGQLDVTVRLCDWLTRRFGIQRQIPGHRYQDKPVRRLAGGGRDFYGVYGHRDVSADRGAGDPGTAIMKRLFEAGYEDWDLDDAEDLHAWQLRQRDLRMLRRDGIPGPKTVQALMRAGYAHGLWVARPGDGLELVA